MHRRSRSARTESLGEEGSAALEFIVVGVLLLVPLVYLVLTLGAVQEQTLGAEAAARHTARVIAQSESAEAASESGEAVLAGVTREYGMDPDSVHVGITCTPAAAVCPSAGATVIVTIRTRVSLPFMPPIFGLDDLAAIPVEAHSAQKVSRLWGSG